MFAYHSIRNRFKLNIYIFEVMKYDQSSNVYMFQLLTFVLIYFLEDQSRQVLLAQIGSQVGQILVSITHEIC
jgi:hypothetical protein